jgi:prevent-host-death family protein
MKTEVGAFEAKTHLSRLLDQVQAGNDVYITRHGKRVAHLVPIGPESVRKARFGCAKGKPGSFFIAEDFDEPLDDFKAYMP